MSGRRARRQRQSETRRIPTRTLRFALDQNFPAPVAGRFADLFPNIELVAVREIDEAFSELDDWELFLELHRHPEVWDGLVTNDSNLLSLPKEMVVLSQTTLTLVVLEGEGGSPVKAVGLLLAHLSHIAHQSDLGQAQIWSLKQSMKGADMPLKYLERVAEKSGTTVEVLRAQHRVPPRELTRRRVDS